MAHKIIKSEYSAHCDASILDIVCDTDDDFASLPAACTGSMAVSIATGNVRAVNTSGEWVPFAEE